MPIFEILTFSLGSSFIITCIKLTVQQRWHTIKGAHPAIWLLGVVGLVGNDMFLVAGTKLAPPAHVHLLCYTWPTMVILMTGLMPGERLHTRYVLAAIVGLLGVYFLVCQDGGFASFHWQYSMGYLSAFCGAFVWACYCVLSRRNGKAPPEMIGMYCGVGAILSLVCHLKLETFVTPNFSQSVCLVAIGTVTSCLAFYFWDYGSKFGNLRLLSLLSYLSPLVGLGLLSALGRAELSSSIVLASVLIVSAPCVTFFSKERLLRSKPSRKLWSFNSFLFN